MEEDELSDEFLMDAIAGKAMWALERLHDRYSKRFYALAYRITADHMAAEELVQDAFVAVWQSAATYAPQASPVRSWLFTIIYHRTINYLRSLRRSSAPQQVSWQEVEEYERFALADVWEEVWSSAQIAELHACLERLPTEQREMIELAYFGGWTHTEIAQRCQIPIGTVKARLRLGVLQLRRTLERKGVGERIASGNIYYKEARSKQAVPVIFEATESRCATGYVLCRDGSCRCFRYTEWERLVEQVEAFEFRGISWCFIARKEKRAHGCAYWYAYDWGSSGRRKIYLGRPAELTLARLEEVERRLYEEKMH